MDLGDRRGVLTGLLVFGILVVVNYVAQTPYRFAAAALGLFPLFYAVRKLRKDFGVPLFYYRSEGMNYWSAAFGGLTALIFSLYGSLQGFEQLSIPRYAADVSVGLIYLLLLAVLLTGAVLKDVKEGYIELEMD